jgi:fructokinase
MEWGSRSRQDKLQQMEKPSSKPHLIIGLGELLWDILPDGPRLGGAPANFAVMAGRLGNTVVLLSRVGWDDLGTQALDRLESLPVDASLVQIDSQHETGRVTVNFDDGEPQYTIHQPAAWDSLELSEEWVKIAGRADAICFGSLAQRSLESRQTIQTLIAQTSPTCVRVFDVNLRKPFYTSEVIRESLELATVVKMNEAEVPIVMDLLDIDLREMPLDRDPLGTDPLVWDTVRLSALRLFEEFSALKLVAVTRGSKGSLLATRKGVIEHPGIPTEVIDTVGAGDAFTAAMIHYLLLGADIDTMSDAGNRWGSWVASQSGSMPDLAEEVKAAITLAIDRGRTAKGL